MTAPVPTTAPALPELVDVAVIGGAAAGLNAALMLGRSLRSVVVLDAGTPRNAPAAGVHGLLGREGTPPLELLARGREEVRSYGGLILEDAVLAARPADPVDGDLRFALDLASGARLTARRIIVATGVRDELPELPGLAEHWGHGLVHCPYCHGYEVRDRAIGIVGVGPGSVHQALMFRQLSEDVVYLVRGTELPEDGRALLAARGVRILEEDVVEVLAADDADPVTGSRVAGVRLASGETLAREVLAVASRVHPRLDGLEGLGLGIEEMPGGFGEKVPTAMAGVTAVPGVWAAGNVAEPMAQVGASAAGGALAGAHVNGDLVMAEAQAAAVSAPSAA